jgi:hypothetical protein
MKYHLNGEIIIIFDSLTSNHNIINKIGFFLSVYEDFNYCIQN